MTELNLFLLDPNNSKELEAVFNLPVVQKAFSALQSANLPSGFTQGMAPEMQTQAAHNWHYYAGFHDSLRLLKKLAEPPPKPPEDPLEAWDANWAKEFTQQNQAKTDSKEA